MDILSQFLSGHFSTSDTSEPIKSEESAEGSRRLRRAGFVATLGTLVLTALVMPPRLTSAQPPVLNAGDILVTDSIVNTLFRVDPTTGAQASISSGGLFMDPVEVAVEATGSILVVDSGVPGVIRVDAGTGAQTLLSFGGFLVNPHGIAIEATGSILVSDPDGGSAGCSIGPCGRITRVDPVTGMQTTLSVDGISSSL